MPERYCSPKEIAAALDRDHGLTVTAGYVCAIKRASIKHRAGLFVVGKAQPSAVLEWLRAHPEFTRDSFEHVCGAVNGGARS